MCECCGERVERKATVQMYCDNCAKKIDREKAKERMKILRDNKNCSI